MIGAGCVGPVVLTYAVVRSRPWQQSLEAVPGISGISPCLMLFGQRLKLYGELYANGEPAGRHPDGDDPESVLARRFRIRTSARQAIERHFAKELVRKTASAI